MGLSIEKTEGVVLRVHGFSNTSHIVHWLTPDRGRLVTSVKGACRPKSLFLGQYDLFYTCEILYYTGGVRGVHPLRECSPLDTRPRFRTDWRAALAASYAADLSGHVAEAMPPTPALHALLVSTLDRLARHGASAATLLAFETRLLPLLGMTPDLDGCPHCAESALADRARFSIPDGRLVCPACSPEAAAAEITLTRKQLALLRLAFGSDVYAPSIFARLAPPDIAVLRRFLGIFLHYHLDARLDGRAIAWDALGARAVSAPPALSACGNPTQGGCRSGK